MSTHVGNLDAPTPSQVLVRVRAASIPLTLGLLIVLSSLVRAVASFHRATPRLLPDEYLYTGLARSLANGHGFTILGQSTSFPQLLEPLLIAPFWSTDDTTLALNLTQGFHSVLMSLTVVPVYLLARTLRLSKGLAVGCAVVTVLTPELMYSSYMTADAIGYLLAMVAVLAAVRALQRPSALTQSCFLVAAALASFARMQYVLFFPVFVVAALVVERGHPLRTARRYPILVGVPLLVAPVALIASSGTLLGRYQAVTGFGLSSDTVTVSLSTGMMLSVATGVALTPGALAWAATTIRRPRSREYAAFASIAGTLVLSLVAASAVMSVETESDRFFERYLIVAVPLTAIAFCCWFTNGRPGKRLVIVSALVMVVAVARIPLAEQFLGQGSADSPTLLALSRLGGIIGLGNASLVAAIGVTVCAGLAIASALSPRVPAAMLLGVTIAAFAALSVGAHAADIRASDRAFAATWGHRSTWIDDAHPGPVVLIQTPGANPFISQFATIWSSSIERAVPLLGETYVAKFDGVEREAASIRTDGTLLVHGSPVQGAALFATAGSTPIFGRPAKVVTDKYLTLVMPDGHVRLTVFAEGVRSSSTISPIGKIAAYPTASGHCTRATLLLTLPDGIPPTTLDFRRSSGKHEAVVVRAGHIARIAVDSTRVAGSALVYRTASIGGRAPGPDVTNVANGQITAKSVPCGLQSQT